MIFLSFCTKSNTHFGVSTELWRYVPFVYYNFMHVLNCVRAQLLCITYFSVVDQTDLYVSVAVEIYLKNVFAYAFIEALQQFQAQNR